MKYILIVAAVVSEVEIIQQQSKKKYEGLITEKIPYEISRSLDFAKDWWTILLKGRRVSAKSGSLSIVCVQLGPQELSVVWSSGLSAIQGIEVNGRTVWTFRIVRYIVGVRY